MGTSGATIVAPTTPPASAPLPAAFPSPWHLGTSPPPSLPFASAALVFNLFSSSFFLSSASFFFLFSYPVPAAFQLQLLILLILRWC